MRTAEVPERIPADLRWPGRLPSAMLHRVAAGSLWLCAAALVPRPTAAAEDPAPARPDAEFRPERELYVPLDALNVVLQSGTRRVMLGREAYEELRRRARKTAGDRAPESALITSAAYRMRIEDDRARIAGDLGIDVLNDGLHAVPLDLGGVGLLSASLDSGHAPMGREDDGRVLLFVEGKGSHALKIEAVTPVQTTAAQQLLTFRLPVLSATRLTLTTPGDVEVKTGAAVVDRTYDEAANETRVELLPEPGNVTLAMSLNSRLKRRDRVVMARSVLVSEVTRAFERIHATVSLDVLHRPVRDFRFAVPAGFEVTDVRTPALSRWEMTTEGAARVLTVTLREETTGTRVLGLSALRTAPRPDAAWSFVRIEPLDVVGQVALVGVLLEDRLKAHDVAPRGLIPLDRSVLLRALPRSVVEADATDARIRPLVAYYAPQPDFALAARLTEAAGRVSVTSHTLLILGDAGLEARASFAIRPLEEELFAAELTLPDQWDVTGVTARGGESLPFEVYQAAEGRRLLVRLVRGLAAGAETNVLLTATHVPEKWFDEWETREAAFPVFAVQSAARDAGALAVDARDDLRVQPAEARGLSPLDENEKDRYGLAGIETDLAYRYESRPLDVRFRIERVAPRVTAEIYSFFRVQPDVLWSRYEVVCSVERARTRRVDVTLPASTPRSLTVRGHGGAEIKEWTARDEGEKRHWRILLARAQRDTVHVSLEGEAVRDDTARAALDLPLARAAGVDYQSGMVSVEGSAELDIRVTAGPRRVDVGELTDAEYRPGRRLIGAFGFVGEPPPVRLSVERRASYSIPPALVERGELATAFSADGVSQSEMRFRLKSKVTFVEVGLPPKSALWSTLVNGEPVKPQELGSRILLPLPPGQITPEVRLVYETAVNSLGFWDRVRLPAPRLFLHETTVGRPREVPVADFEWQVHVPTGFEVIGSRGSVASPDVRTTPLAAVKLARFLHRLAGGISPRHGLVGCALAPLAMTTKSARVAASRGRAVYGLVPELTEQAPPAPPPPVATTEPAAQRTEATRHRDILNRIGVSIVPMDAPEGEIVTVGTPTVPTLARPSSVARQPPRAAPSSKKTPTWALRGAESLKIDLTRTGKSLRFQSLGEDPRLDLTLVGQRRVKSLAFFLAASTFLGGIALTRATRGRKVSFVTAALLVATLFPVIPGMAGLALAMNSAFYAAAALVPYYLLASAALSTARRVVAWRARRAAAVAVGLLVALGVPGAGTGHAAGEASPRPSEPRCVVEMQAPEPVRVPDDAIVVPYSRDPRRADQVLVPYSRFEALWKQANPDRAPDTAVPPARFSLAGQRLRGTLLAQDFLRLDGELEVHVHVDEYVEVPFPIEGAVLESAIVNGAPAKLRAGSEPPRAPPGKAAPANASPQTKTVAAEPAWLGLRGKGVHRLAFVACIRLERQGGWRHARARLPAAPAAALELRVPDAGTEVAIAANADPSVHRTGTADETLRASLGREGQIDVQWRPRVSEGEVDRTLTVESAAVLDVREDHLRLAWTLNLRLRRGEHETFSAVLPDGYRVEEVTGANIRGWDVQTADPAGGSAGRLTVRLLERSREQEQFSVQLCRESPVTREDGGAEVAVPCVSVPEAARHTGTLTIRRSPMLSVRTLDRQNVRRSDLPDDKTLAERTARMPESPLGIRSYEAFEFVTVPFAVRLSVTPHVSKASASLQTILRVSDRERGAESRVILSVRDRPVHRVRISLPADFDVDGVSTPGESEWIVEDGKDGKTLNLLLAAGLEGEIPLVFRGRLGSTEPTREFALPRFRVLDVPEQNGDIVVQVDPAFDARLEGMTNVESVLLKRTFGWLQEGQRSHARLALHYKNPDFAGRLILDPRSPDVSCHTVTNLRVTDRAIEETVLLDFAIRNAGIREVEFLLPGYMREAVVNAPLLRSRTVAPVEGADQVLVKIELQDEVMNELRVLVEQDRLLTAGAHGVRLPEVRTGRLTRRYAAIENAGRDEIEIVDLRGLAPLTREQKEWAAVAPLVRGGSTHAYVAGSETAGPSLSFQSRQRAAVETAGARIGMARALVLVDPNGDYRARQTYQVDNRTEQFLTVVLPDGAALWTAQVAGEFVKPVLPETGDRRRVRIPLVKTAAGDLDYPVDLTYGGSAAPRSGLRPVSFPLLQTVNINVELSQVELRLPRTHTWFHFDGTMRLIQDETDFKAGVLGYKTRLAKRLIDTLQYGNVFEQARAASNLKTLKGSIQDYQNSVQAFTLAPNKALERELSDSAVVMEDAEKQLAQAEKARKSDDSDNRVLLNDAFVSQKNTGARNVVFGRNWDLQAWDQAGRAQTVNPQAFNSAWLTANALQVSGIETQSGFDRVQKGLAAVDAAGRRGHEKPAEPDDWGARQQDRQGGQQRLVSMTEPEQAKAGQYAKRRGQKELAARYQQELDKKVPNGPAVDFTPQPAAGDPRAPAQRTPPSGGQMALAGNGYFSPGVSVPFAGADAATGLASLDVTLPPDDPARWRTVRFTTPRGQTRILAYAMARSVLDGLTRVGVAVLAVAIVLALRALAGTGSLGTSGRRVLSTVAVFTAAIGLFVGVYPAACVAVLIAAVIFRAWTRRATVRAS